MNKQYLFLLFYFLLCSGIHAQKQFFVKNLNKESEIFLSDLNGYVENLGRNELSRDVSLDSVAAERLNYFLTILAENSKFHSLSYLVDQIPSGSLGHKRSFGNPQFFVEPENIYYPTSLPFVEKTELKVKAEIMQEDLFMLSSKNSYSIFELAEKAVRSYNYSEGEDFILKHYLKSPSHHNAIVKFARNKVGISIKALITKEKNEEKGNWNYEILIYSVAVFGE